MLRTIPFFVPHFLKCLPTTQTSRYGRRYATVSPSIVWQSHLSGPPRGDFTEVPSRLDSHILQATSVGDHTSLPDIIKQYIETSGSVLEASLPYESRPSETRRPKLENTPDSCNNVIIVAHCARFGSEHKVILSSGFALNVQGARADYETLILTCAHTLEEIRQSPALLSGLTLQFLMKYTGTFIVAGSSDSVKVHPVSRVVSALPRSDLLLLSSRLPPDTVNTLPVSPYPAHKETPVRAHFVSHQKPAGPGWTPWIGDTWGKWQIGKILGYRDFAGRETEPGTYDALSHLFFTPLPTAGSSGGPIIDEESGAVVGVMLGTRMDSDHVVKGVRGWGVPSESIFEMFTLPGLAGKK
ncbi:hypothetical protein GALMADRAFT_287378 [Galerina marginata CBS 339.88]|uniref:Peptidase S1 domain-containing protein n=1 Tax=Galerina marginata (strain CBS 339.88) TaxID=685588 RepID=A0A067TNI6_GALM3|nr:hypothetical protein GALMADRAFT_287378 [Galerina marginata CBS 339.88]